MIVRSMALAVGGLALSASLIAQAEPQLQIDSVAAKDGRITFTGKNFGDTVAVTIVGEQPTPLTVLSTSETEIACQLPALTSGIYVIRITRDAGATPEGTAKTSLLIE